MNALVKLGDNAAKFLDRMGRIGAEASDVDAHPILKINQESGEMVYGADDTPLGRDCVLALNILSIKEGYIAFSERSGEIALTMDDDVNGEPIPANFLYALGEALPDIGGLPEIEADGKGKNARAPEYKYQISCEFTIIEGEDKGTVLRFNPTSNGGLKMLRRLLKEIHRRVANGNEEVVPLIEIYSESYYNKKWRKDIHNPCANINGWATLDGETDDNPRASKRLENKASANDNDEQEDTKPARRTRGRQAEVQEAEVVEDEEEAPCRTRERRETPRRTRGRQAEVQEAEVVEDEEEAPRRTRGRRRRG